MGSAPQRPAAGWGSVQELMDAAYNARAFYGGPAGPNMGVLGSCWTYPGGLPLGQDRPRNRSKFRRPRSCTTDGSRRHPRSWMLLVVLDRFFLARTSLPRSRRCHSRRTKPDPSRTSPFYRDGIGVCMSGAALRSNCGTVRDSFSGFTDRLELSFPLWSTGG